MSYDKRERLVREVLSEIPAPILAEGGREVGRRILEGAQGSAAAADVLVELGYGFLAARLGMIDEGATLAAGVLVSAAADEAIAA